MIEMIGQDKGSGLGMNYQHQSQVSRHLVHGWSLACIDAEVKRSGVRVRLALTLALQLGWLLAYTT